MHTEDGRRRIDNNLAENAIPPFVIWTMNSLFCATVATANLYRIIETAKANNLGCYSCLKAVFTEIPKATSLEGTEVLLSFKPAIDLK